MARETGLEPATSTVTGWHSNQLSYSPASSGSISVAAVLNPLLSEQYLRYFYFKILQVFKQKKVKFFLKNFCKRLYKTVLAAKNWFIAGFSGLALFPMRVGSKK